jgi:uncharacterized protein (TIGR02466 family)
MLTKAELIQFFPTCLWVQEIEHHAELNRNLIQELAKLQRADPSATEGYSAWQSPGQLHGQPGFQMLEDYFLSAARSVLRFLKCDYEDCTITDCWANINRQGYAHMMHTHPNNYLSGVYYVKVPPDSGRIVFADPRPQASAITPRLKENTPFNSNQMHFEPAAGKLILFHSWLPHLVEVNTSSEERISIAFNVMLKGPIGVEKASAHI